ncbi:MAG: hypothetical protein K5979_12335 [Ruminococcus sp.]|nr:hypothetical protein [Ruminococcus sp.]
MPKRIKLKNKKISLSKSLFKLVMVAFVTGCLVLSITWTLDSKEKEKELVAIQTKIDAYKISNEEMQRNLDSDDLSDYMERIALEERGYAYPNERRFYDISRD